MRIREEVSLQHVDEEMNRRPRLLTLLQQLVQGFSIELEDGFGLRTPVVLQVVDQQEQPSGLLAKDSASWE
jgi:hypothetical protein